MKKILLGLGLMMGSSAVMADFIGVHGKVGMWNAELSGEVATVTDVSNRGRFNLGVPSFSERGLEKENHNIFTVSFEHPIPLLPNLRVAYLNTSAEGWSPDDIVTDPVSAIINGVDADIQVSQPVFTRMEFAAFDVTPYWEILDNWVSLDIGLSLRLLDGEFYEFIEETEFAYRGFGGNDGCGPLEAVQTNVGPGCLRDPINKSTPIEIVLPMLYTKVQFDLPFSGLYGAVTAQGISFDGNTMVDAEAEIGYMFDLPLMEIGAAFGYRHALLKADDLDSLFADASLSGMQFTVGVHF